MVVPGVSVGPTDLESVAVPEARLFSSQSVFSLPSVPELSLSGLASSVLDGRGTVTYLVTEPSTTALVEMGPLVPLPEDAARLCAPEPVPDGLSPAAAVPEAWVVPKGLSESVEVWSSGGSLAMVLPADKAPVLEAWVVPSTLPEFTAVWNSGDSLSMVAPVLEARLSGSIEIWSSGDELSMVVRLESHPCCPHADVPVPPEADTAVTLPLSDTLGVPVVAPRPEVWICGPSESVRHTSGVTVMYDVTAEGQFVTVTVLP